NWPWRQLRSALAAVVPTPKELTPEERTAALKAQREAAKKAEREAWEERQRQEHLAWVAAGVAGMERQRRLAELNGAWIPEDEGRGGLAEITLRDGEWIDLGTGRRGRW